MLAIRPRLFSNNVMSCDCAVMRPMAFEIVPPVNTIGRAELIDEIYGHVLSAHGDIGLDCATFGKHVFAIAAKHLPTGSSHEELVAFIRTLHGADIGLCCACGRGSEPAWQRFKTLYRAYLVDICRFTKKGHLDSKDFAEGLIADLYLPNRSGRSRVLSYDGRSSLATWLRVVACNRIINERQAKSAFAISLDALPPLAAACSMNIDLAISHRRYSRAIRESLEASLRLLTSQEKLIIQWRFEQGMQLGEIARLLGVHQSTVTRQLEKAITRVRMGFARLLATDYLLSQAAVNECISVAEESLADESSILSVIRGTAEMGVGSDSASPTGGMAYSYTCHSVY
jgi:RNA polymerase sigma-70 factor